jgi:quinol monooxygenase YgiN
MSEMENGMIWLLAKFKVQDGKQAEFEAVMASLVEQVRAKEAETLCYTLTKHKKDPTVYVMIEQYASEDARKAHGQTVYFQEALPKFMACLDGNPELTSLVGLA